VSTETFKIVDQPAFWRPKDQNKYLPDILEKQRIEIHHLAIGEAMLTVT